MMQKANNKQANELTKTGIIERNTNVIIQRPLCAKFREEC